MKKILFVCNAGMSTAFLVQQLNKKAKEEGLDWKFDAEPLLSYQNSLEGVDLLCVAPQIATEFEKVKKEAQHHGVKKFYQISRPEYSIINADDLFASIKKSL